MFRLTVFETHAVEVESRCRKSETDASGLHGFEGAFETGPIRFTAERAPTRKSACLGWATPLGSSAPCASSRDHAGREARRACHAVAHGRRRAPSPRCSSKASPASAWNSWLRSRADAGICLLSRSGVLPDNAPPRPLVRSSGAAAIVRAHADFVVPTSRESLASRAATPHRAARDARKPECPPCFPP